MAGYRVGAFTARDAGEGGGEAGRQGHLQRRRVLFAVFAGEDEVEGRVLPGQGLVPPAESLGSKPPVSQPSVICIGASPTFAGPPDQGVSS